MMRFEVHYEPPYDHSMFDLNALAPDNPAAPYVRNTTGPGFTAARPGSARARKIADRHAKAKVARQQNRKRRIS
ncbi:hypothetical protein ACOI1H_21480 [Loktanella sp. DJP18]|uniref:hypothetical protein n=1 Tax=Loktanella sp. DJP18 TaxID=3409788 RepID=UPI003BB67BBE